MRQYVLIKRYVLLKFKPSNCVFSGGTFALYSLLCRHAKVSLLPNRQVADESLSTYKLEGPPEITNSSWLKTKLEKHKCLHTALLILVLLGTCMVIGDGVLTPAISGVLHDPRVFLHLHSLYFY